MKFNDYQKKSRATAAYPKIGGHGFLYPVLGLAGEAGELMNKVQKIYRDDDSNLTKEKKQEIAEELGDVLWYAAQLATELGIPLADVAKGNIKKLHSRKKRGMIRGSGDNR
ncbi:MAG: nucleoside triphosphate pyrophosphohydrolase family protein [Parcubacteria group bacterium]|nr:nucleoside triphosphate pyrophosphohydrolase family protein [Parcubacteria group bacterium]MBI3074807.1 nucleoside triphosphate pyrophosphohydrolase family protein [Parcubacteria group bacterium]